MLTPLRAIHEIEKTDLILLPAFLPPFDMDNPRIKTICEWTRHNHKNKNDIACTGTFLLAETGLLDGRVATTNWQFAAIFKRQFPKVKLQIDRLLTEDNGLYCTGTATVFMNLCLHLIENTVHQAWLPAAQKGFSLIRTGKARRHILSMISGKIILTRKYLRHSSGWKKTMKQGY